MKFILCSLGKDDVYLIPYELMKLKCLDNINSGNKAGMIGILQQGKHWDKAIKYAKKGEIDKVLDVLNAFEGSEIDCCTECSLDYNADLVKIYFEVSTGAFVNFRLNIIPGGNTNIIDKDAVKLQNKLNLAGKDAGSVVVFDKEIYCIHEYLNYSKVNKALRCTISGINIDKDVFHCFDCTFKDIKSMKIKTFEGCVGTEILRCKAWLDKVYLVEMIQVANSIVWIEDARDLRMYYLTESTLELNNFMNINIVSVEHSIININKDVEYGDIGVSYDIDKFEFTFEHIKNSMICFNKGCDRFTIERLVGMLKESGSGNKIGVPSHIYSKYKYSERYSGILVDLSARGQG